MEYLEDFTNTPIIEKCAPVHTITPLDQHYLIEKMSKNRYRVYLYWIFDDVPAPDFWVNVANRNKQRVFINPIFNGYEDEEIEKLIELSQIRIIQ